MDRPSNPLYWSTREVCQWLRETFQFSEEVLERFQENDVDGSVLIEDLDHEALKTEFGINSFGQRAKILKTIWRLRGNAIHKTAEEAGQQGVDGQNATIKGTLGLSDTSMQSQGLFGSSTETTMSTGTSVLNMHDLEEALPTYTHTLAKNNHDSVSSGINDTGIAKRRSERGDAELNEIPLLKEPLKVYLDGSEKSLRGRENRPRSRLQSQNIKKSFAKMDDISLGETDGEDGDEEDDDANVEMDNAYTDEDDLPLALRVRNSKKLINNGLVGDLRSTGMNHVGIKRFMPTLVPTASQHMSIGIHSALSSTVFNRSSSIPTPQDLEPVNYIQRRQKPISAHSDSNTVSKQTKQTIKKVSFFSRTGASISDIFFKNDGALESDSDDNWAVRPSYSPQNPIPEGYRLLVQRNMKRILRSPPVLETLDHIVYAPVRRRQKDVPVLVFTNNGGTVEVRPSTWDVVFKNKSKESSSLWVDLSQGEQDLTSIDFRKFKGGVTHDLQSHTVENGDDPVLPLYGESDASEYTTDEELYKQVAREEKERLKPHPKKSEASSSKTVTALSPADAQILIQEYKATHKEKWEISSKLRLESRRMTIYDNLLKRNGNPASAIKWIQSRINELAGKRLTSIVDAFMDTTYKNANEIHKACKAMDRTLDELWAWQWKLDLIQGPLPSLVGAEDGTKHDIEVISSKDPPHPRAGSPSPTIQSSDSTGHREYIQNSGKDDTDEEIMAAEERRQKELDRQFIDDSELNVDIQDGIDNLAKDFRRKKNKQREKGEPKAKPENGKKAKEDREDMTPTTSTSSLNSPKEGLEDPNDQLKEVRRPTGQGASSQTETTLKEGQTLNSKGMDQIQSDGSLDGLRIIDEDIEMHDGASDTLPQTISDISAGDISYHDEEMDNDLELNSDASLNSEEPEESPTDEKEEDIPKSSVYREMRYPTWRNTLRDDDALIRELRLIRKDVSRGKRLNHRGTYLSAWQEYTEWIELDCGDTISFKDFLAWKDEGNTTKEYRKKAREAALRQAEEERQKKAERREQRARECKEKRMVKKQGLLRAKMEAIKAVKATKATKVAKASVNKSMAEQEEKETRMEEYQKDELKKVSAVVDKGTAQSEVITIQSDSSEDDTVAVDRQPSVAPSKNHSMRNRSEDQDLSLSDSHSKDPKLARKARGATNQSNSSKRSIDSGEDMATEPLTIPQRQTKKRGRIIRNRFGDSSDDGSALSGEDDKQVKSVPKRRTVQVMREEAPDVLRLRNDALKNESELKKRIADQEMRAKIRGTNGSLEKDEVLINPGHKKTEHPVAIPGFLARKLKPHQIEGVRFMWKNVVMFDGGCILAHAMGLGKTFQVIAFLYVLLREIHQGNKDVPKKLEEGRILLLMPPILLSNWEYEFKKWITEGDESIIKIHKLPLKVRTYTSRIACLEEWHKEGGVLLLGYQKFRDLCSGAGVSPEVAERYKQLILQGSSLIIADEGHAIKTSTAKIAATIKNVKSTSRIILTGYPLQNRLEEYWCMVDFIRPKFLGDISTFRHNYIRPINNGLYPDSTSVEKKISAKKLNVLAELIKHFVFRRDQSVLRASLPKKTEFVVSCKLSKMQYFLYTSFIATIFKNDQWDGGVLGNGHILLTICNHPAAFKASLAAMKKQKDKLAKANASANSGATESNTSVPSTGVKGVPVVIDDSEDIEAENQMERALSQNKEITSSDWSGNIIWERNVTDISHGYKIKILMDILTECKVLKEKVLVFTRSIPTLDFIEYTASEMNFKSLKLDGDTKHTDRQDMINEFNDSDELDLFLISSGAGSQGINLVAASRVVIFDVGWNPSNDEQAIARAFRYGQTRKVFVYRLQTFGTWEEKLYKTNLHKLGLSNRVVDKKNPIKGYTKLEMKQYFQPPPSTTPIWATEENIEALFAKPDMEDPVMRKVIENNRDILTRVIPQSELVREEVSDLTEADMLEIANMIEEEKRRIGGFEVPTTRPAPQTSAQQQQQQQQQQPAMTSVSQSLSQPQAASNQPGHHWQQQAAQPVPTNPNSPIAHMRVSALLQASEAILAQRQRQSAMASAATQPQPATQAIGLELRPQQREFSEPSSKEQWDQLIKVRQEEMAKMQSEAFEAARIRQATLGSTSAAKAAGSPRAGTIGAASPIRSIHMPKTASPIAATTPLEANPWTPFRALDPTGPNAANHEGLYTSSTSNTYMPSPNPSQMSNGSSPMTNKDTNSPNVTSDHNSGSVSRRMTPAEYEALSQIRPPPSTPQPPSTSSLTTSSSGPLVGATFRSVLERHYGPKRGE